MFNNPTGRTISALVNFNHGYARSAICVMSARITPENTARCLTPHAFGYFVAEPVIGGFLSFAQKLADEVAHNLRLKLALVMAHHLYDGLDPVLLGDGATE